VTVCGCLWLSVDFQKSTRRCIVFSNDFAIDFLRFWFKIKKILPKINSQMHRFYDRFFHGCFFDFGSFSSQSPPKSFQKSIPRCITFSIGFSINFSLILAPFWKPTWNHVGHLGGTWRGLGGLLGASRAVLEASWGLLAAKTHQKRGGCEF